MGCNRHRRADRRRGGSRGLDECGRLQRLEASVAQESRRLRLLGEVRVLGEAPDRGELEIVVRFSTLAGAGLLEWRPDTEAAVALTDGEGSPRVAKSVERAAEIAGQMRDAISTGS